METTTVQHQWIMMTQTPVSILFDDDGEPVVFVDPDMAQGAEVNAVYGCLNCDQYLSSHATAECVPSSD